MASARFVRQFIRDDTGDPVAGILPIEEYHALVRLQRAATAHGDGKSSENRRKSLYGALRHLKGEVATTEQLDETRRELWSGWEKDSLE